MRVVGETIVLRPIKADERDAKAFKEMHRDWPGTAFTDRAMAKALNHWQTVSYLIERPVQPDAAFSEALIVEHKATGEILGYTEHKVVGKKVRNITQAILPQYRGKRIESDISVFTELNIVLKHYVFEVLGIEEVDFDVMTEAAPVLGHVSNRSMYKHEKKKKQAKRQGKTKERVNLTKRAYKKHMQDSNDDLVSVEFYEGAV